MIPVMLMGVLIRGKKYSVIEYICVLLITGGISLFQIGKVFSSLFLSLFVFSQEKEEKSEMLEY